MEAGIFTLALANVNLPHNAEIQSILIRVNDVNNMNVNVRLKEIDFPGNAINTLSTVQSAGSGGYGTFTKTLTTPHLVDNQNSNYYLEVSTSGGLITDEVILESVHIEYKY